MAVATELQTTSLTIRIVLRLELGGVLNNLLESHALPLNFSFRGATFVWGHIRATHYLLLFLNPKPLILCLQMRWELWCLTSARTQ